jgi:Sulfotransferase family
MLLAPRHGFVFLAVPKTGSTAIEQAFRSYADMSARTTPSFKHTRYAQFQHFLRPFLASQGFPRDSYEVVCVFREPIDWLSSWWRYRSREELADPSHPSHRNYAGHLSFEQFAYAYMKGDEQFAQGVGRQFQIVRARPGQPKIDRIFRYERLDLLVDFLCEKISEEVQVKVRNVSPERSFALSEGCERELRRFFKPDYRIYEQAIRG